MTPVEDLVAWMNDRVKWWYSLAYPILTPETYVVETGKRYAKIVSVRKGGARSVHLFVEISTGKVFKAEGWTRPAKGVRYDLSDPDSLARLKDYWDPYGSYLYANPTKRTPVKR